MQLIFLYGQPASGKLTVARALAERTGLPLFHNHLVVDAVGAVFPFGSDAFIRLRERFWLDVMTTAVKSQQSLIFTFAPEPTVTPSFVQTVRTQIEAAGGDVILVALTVPEKEQERRLIEPGRSAFGKMRSVDLLRQLRDQFAACMTAMPEPAITIDTAAMTPLQAADAIASIMSSHRRP